MLKMLDAMTFDNRFMSELPADREIGNPKCPKTRLAHESLILTWLESTGFARFRLHFLDQHEQECSNGRIQTHIGVTCGLDEPAIGEQDYPARVFSTEWKRGEMS